MSSLHAARPLNSAAFRRLLQKRFQLTVWERYGAAIAIVAFGVLLRLALLQSLGDRLVYLTLYPAVMVAAFIGGFGPGILAMVVSGAAAGSLWNEHRPHFTEDPSEWLGLTIFCVGSIIMAAIAEVSRRARQRLEERSGELLQSHDRLQEEVRKREEADKRLRQNDERFRLASLSDAIRLYEQDAELRYTWLYPEHTDMSAALGRTDVELLGAVDGKALADRKLAVMESGLPQRVEVRIVLHGQVRFFDTFISPKHGENGAIVGVAGTALEITQRKEADENRRRLAAIVEFSDDAIIGTDLHGTVTTWNQGAVRIFGYEAADIVGKSIALLTPADREEDRILERIKEGQRIEHFETRRVRKDGSLVDISLSVSPVRDDQGVIVGASKIAREITERVRSERTAQFIAALNERLTMVEYSEDIVRIACEVTGQFLQVQRCFFAEWNEPGGQLNVPEDWHVEGLPPLRGIYPLSDFGPPEWRQQLAAGLSIDDVEKEPALQDFLAGYRSTGIRAVIASGILRKGNAVISLVGSCSKPRAWQPDELQLLRTVAERVWPLADRARSERALRRSERQLRLITDNAPVLLAHLDKAHRFKFANQTYARLYQREVKDIIGAHLSEVVGLDIYNVSRPHLDLAFGGERVEYELEIFPASGPHWVHVIYTPEESATGEIVGVMALLTDITARKQTEHEVSLARDLAVAASRAKDEFLAALSHELRTPLNPVLLLASEAAENAELAPEVRRDFQVIRKNVELEARLIDDLLDLTRITRGKLPLDQKNVDAHVVLQDALSVVRPDAEEKRIALTVELAAPESRVFADPVRLQQVYWNVLKNAVKFTPAGGRIHLRTKNSRPDSKFTVTVQDSGIGMTADELGRVFNAFAQGDHAGGGGSHRFGGIGLGLTISRMLIERQAGVLHATSPGPGQGSTFVVELPLATTPAINGQQPPPPLAGDKPPPLTDLPLRVPARRVLVVEDHGPTRDAVASLLRRRNYEVLTAASVGEARSRVQEGGVRLVVSDIGLPDGDGCELMAELRERMGLPGIALTGYGMEADVARTAKAGFLAHLTKPVRVQALDAALTAAWATIEPSRS